MTTGTERTLRVIVVGLGSPLRRDDGLGLSVLAPD